MACSLSTSVEDLGTKNVRSPEGHLCSSDRAVLLPITRLGTPADVGIQGGRYPDRPRRNPPLLLLSLTVHASHMKVHRYESIFAVFRKAKTQRLFRPGGLKFCYRHGFAAAATLVRPAFSIAILSIPDLRRSMIVCAKTSHWF